MRLNRTTRTIGVILFIVFLIAAVALLLPGVRGGLGGLYAAYLILSGQIDYTIAGDSMSPNYNNDEQWKFEEYNNQIPQRGDTVLFDAEESYEENSGSKRLRVKRIVGLPGETVLIQDGSVFINGMFLDEASYLLPETKTSGGSVLRNGEEIVIPEGTPAGDYILRVIVEYDGKKAPATLPIKVLPARKEGCFDGIKNQNEESVDCGGVCKACEIQSQECDDQNPCTEDILENGKCVNNQIEPCCGNSLCEFDETEESCSTDCRAAEEIPTSALEEIKNIALANPSKALQECGKIEIPDLKDTCISSIGEAQKDKTYCTRIQGERIKDLCYANIAKLSNDNSICRDILFAPRRDSCYMNFMIDNDDYTVCEKLTDSNFRYQCESLRQLHQISQG